MKPQDVSDARQRYGDIIDREHYVDPNHPPMARLNRAAQFSPFAALTGYEDLIDEAARETDAWAEPDDSAKEEIDRNLHSVLSAKSPVPVTVTWFVPDGRKSGGAYLTATGTVRKFSGTDRTITLNSGEAIPLEAVTDLRAEGPETPEPQ